MTGRPLCFRMARGYTLVEITLVVLILGILTIFAARQLDGSDAARAQELQTVAARVAGDWTLMAASCGIGTDIDKSSLGATGNPVGVMMNGTGGLRPDLQTCIGATGVKPLDDVLHPAVTAPTLEGYPVSLAGGVSQPFTVTYGSVPVGVATDAVLKFAAVAPALPLSTSNQTDARVRWQRQTDGDYTLQFLFDRAVVAAATPSPWAAPATPAVSGLTPATLVPQPIHNPVLASVKPQSPGLQTPVTPIQPSPCSSGCQPTVCVSNCGSTPPSCTGSSCQPTGCAAGCGTLSPPSTGCTGNFANNFGSSSSGPGSSAISGGGYTGTGGSTTGSNSYTTSAGPGTATANGGGTNTTTGAGSGPVSQQAGNCNQTGTSGNGGSASTTGGSWAGGSTSSGGTVTTTTWGTGNSSVNNNSGTGASSSGGSTSSTGSNGSGNLNLSASGGSTSGGGSMTVSN